jgi:hypothetical protein
MRPQQEEEFLATDGADDGRGRTRNVNKNKRLCLTLVRNK